MVISNFLSNSQETFSYQPRISWCHKNKILINHTLGSLLSALDISPEIIKQMPTVLKAGLTVEDNKSRAFKTNWKSIQSLMWGCKNKAVTEEIILGLHCSYWVTCFVEKICFLIRNWMNTSHAVLTMCFCKRKMLKSKHLEYIWIQILVVQPYLITSQSKSED